ncbi:phosphotransferase [Jhaorihella thermophila]|uniref:Phosphotransferase enzyme family protein n=1 Tax=Jhaorihella thermophila TaxID=488547 RepID=A0A1H5U614_9RHOB|nr:Phosphotransferase enzyme family protein [Jhaorihella thermophila]
MQENEARSQAESDPPAWLWQRLLSKGIVSGRGAPVALGGGRSNKVWRIDPEDTGREKNSSRCMSTLVLKLFRSEGRTPLFANDATLETLCLRALAGTGLAPRLIAEGGWTRNRWIVYAHVPGATWRKEPAIVARILTDLHRIVPPVGLPRGRNGSHDLVRQTRTMLADCRSDDAARLRELQPAGAVAPVGHVGLVHGDPVPGNIVIHDGRAVLIDWQSPCLGDPCEDLAIFLSPAMQSVYRKAPLSPEEVSTFLAAYGDKRTVWRYFALRPWFHWRMAAYCLWREEQGCADYREGLRLELEALAAARAGDCMSG